MKRLHIAVALSVGSFLGLPAHGDVSFHGADFSLHGFGQAICGSTGSNVHNVQQPTNLFYDHSLRCDQDSLLGLQLNASMRQIPWLSFTAQTVALGSDRFVPEAEMAFVSLDFGGVAPAIRIGRQKMQFYLFSASKYFGQSYVWVRPPPAVYFEQPDWFDGISANKTYLLGHNWTLTPELDFGRFALTYTLAQHGNLPTTHVDFTGHKMGAFVLDSDYGSVLHLRAEYIVADVTLTSPAQTQLYDVLGMSGLNQAVDALDIVHKYGYFRGFGLEAKPGNWVFDSEYVQSNVPNSIVPKSELYYVLGGYRFGKLTTALTWQHNESGTGNQALQEVPPGAACFAPNGQLVPGLCGVYVSTALNGEKAKDRYYEVSLRYDVTPHVAIKLDYTAYDSGLTGTPSANLLSGGLSFDF